MNEKYRERVMKMKDNKEFIDMLNFTRKKIAKEYINLR